MAFSPEEENTFHSDADTGRFETMGAFAVGTENPFIGIDAYENQWNDDREDYDLIRVAINLDVDVAERFAQKILEYVAEARR